MIAFNKVLVKELLAKNSKPDWEVFLNTYHFVDEHLRILLMNPLPIPTFIQKEWENSRI